tara:strand:- start:1941 stop:2123 length:183 start_codon:yes stop_codon:yes gene_type:complete
MSEKINIIPTYASLDIGIIKIKNLESKINWEVPNVRDFIMMNEMRSLIKGMDVPEKVAEA